MENDDERDESHIYIYIYFPEDDIAIHEVQEKVVVHEEDENTVVHAEHMQLGHDNMSDLHSRRMS